MSNRTATHQEPIMAIPVHTVTKTPNPARVQVECSFVGHTFTTQIGHEGRCLSCGETYTAVPVRGRTSRNQAVAARMIARVAVEGNGPGRGNQNAMNHAVAGYPWWTEVAPYASLFQHWTD